MAAADKRSQPPPESEMTLEPPEPEMMPAPPPSDKTPAPPAEGKSPASQSSAATSPGQDRRGSDEWDASKVPPSRFQKRKGSIYAVPGSRDGHVDRNYPRQFHEMHAEKGYGPGSPSGESGKK